MVSKDAGFSDIRKVIEISGNILSTDGLLAIEFGIAHANPVKEALAREFKDVELLKDLSRRTRFVVARKS